MKKITKLLTVLLLLAVALSLFAACNGSDDGDGDQTTALTGQNPPVTGQTPSPTVSSNEIINQSIDKIERMMGIQAQSTVSLVSFTAPNYLVDYDHERQSILNGAGLGMYFSKFLADPANGIEDNVTYKDTVSEGDITLTVYGRKATTSNGVTVVLENHHSTPVIPIIVYFEYDFQANKPISTSIVQPVLFGDVYTVSLAKFVYDTGMAYSYNISLTTTDAVALQSSLSQKTFTFDKVVENTLTGYNFTKINTSNKTLESYAYSPDRNDSVSATYEQVATLYNSIYGEVKEACVPTELLDTEAAEVKEYYRAMYGFAVEQLQAIMQQN